MNRNRKYQQLFLILSGSLLFSCADQTSSNSPAPSFAGYHSGSGDEITGVIQDRSPFSWQRSRKQRDIDQNQFSTEYAPYVLDVPEPETSTQFNLPYYLYGPNYYMPYGRRFWASHQRLLN